MTLKPVLTAILVALAGPAPAGDGPAAAAVPDAHALARALPERVLDRIRRRPAAYVEDAAELILSFGAGGGIDAAGIGESIPRRPRGDPGAGNRTVPARRSGQ